MKTHPNRIPKRNKKGALELSMNTIVIIVIGVTILTLGLRWVYTLFGGITERSQEIDEQLKKQIEHQEAEARRGWVIEARKGNLVAIRDTVSRMFGTYTNYSARMVNLRQLDRSGVPADDPNRRLVHSQFENAVQSWIQDVNGLQLIRAELSDSGLISLVDNFLERLGQITVAGPDTFDTFEEIVEWSAGVMGRLNSLRPELVPINRRIEELLSGDDLT